MTAFMTINKDLECFLDSCYKKYDILAVFIQNNSNGKFKECAFDRAFGSTIDSVITKVVMFDGFENDIHRERYFKQVLGDKYIKFACQKKESKCTNVEYFDNGTMNQIYALSYYEYNEILPMLEGCENVKGIIERTTNPLYYFHHLQRKSLQGSLGKDWNKIHRHVENKFDLSQDKIQENYSNFVLGKEPYKIALILKSNEYLSTEKKHRVYEDRIKGLIDIPRWEGPRRQQLRNKIHRDYFEYVKSQIGLRLEKTEKTCERMERKAKKPVDTFMEAVMEALEKPVDNSFMEVLEEKEEFLIGADNKTAQLMRVDFRTSEAEIGMHTKAPTRARAHLQKAYLRGANLQKAYPQKADLRGANLQQAHLSEAYLRGANLQGADLRGADLQGAYLQQADMLGADMLGADMEETNLQQAHLERTNLRGADLQKAYLQKAYLQKADMEGAYLRGANLQGANLQGAYLREAHLERTNLQGANLQKAHLQQADLRGANLQGANLQGANLQQASLRGAYLQGAYLERTNLQQADLREADLYRTDYLTLAKNICYIFGLTDKDLEQINAKTEQGRPELMAWWRDKEGEKYKEWRKMQDELDL